MPRKVISANKAPGVEIFEDEAQMYHLLMVRLQHDAEKKKYNRHEMFQSFSPVDYRSMNSTGYFKTYDEVEIVHDPLLKVKGATTAAPITSDAPVGDADVADAAKELIDLRTQYESLYGTPAAEGATIAQLKEFIDSKKQAVVTDRIAEVKQSLVGLGLADLKKEYKATTGKTADAKATADDLIAEIAAAYVAKEQSEPK